MLTKGRTLDFCCSTDRGLRTRSVSNAFARGGCLLPNHNVLERCFPHLCVVARPPTHLTVVAEGRCGKVCPISVLYLLLSQSSCCVTDAQRLARPARNHSSNAPAWLKDRLEKQVICASLTIHAHKHLTKDQTGRESSVSVLSRNRSSEFRNHAASLEHAGPADDCVYPAPNR